MATTTYLAVGEIFIGRVNFKDPVTGELVDVTDPRMSVIAHDDPRGLDKERLLLPQSLMMRVRKGVYVLGIRIDAQFEEFKTYFVNYDANLDSTTLGLSVALHDEERLRITNFQTAIPHFHVSPTEIILLSYYNASAGYGYTSCGCWVVPQGPFFTATACDGLSVCGGEQAQFPDQNTNTGCCNDLGLDFSLD